jgi:hypothetical protein
MPASPGFISSRRQRWERHVSAWMQSGLSKREYSRKHQINPKSLSYWCQRALTGGLHPSNAPHDSPTRVEGHPPNGGPTSLPAKPAIRFSMKDAPRVHFAPVPGGLLAQVSRPPGSRGKVSLFFGRRFRLVIPPDFSPAVLAKIIRTLEGLR